MSQTNRWARNTQLAKYAGVSVMTVWRWKQLPDFPPAAIVGGTEYNDLDVFDAWMATHIARRNAEPIRGRRAAKNLRRKNETREYIEGQLKHSSASATRPRTRTRRNASGRAAIDPVAIK